MKRLALVALPWAVPDRPSAALASLAPFVREQCPDWSVECHYAYVGVALEIGLPLYEVLAEQGFHLGELVHAGLYYPERRAAVRARLADALARYRFALSDDRYYPAETYGVSRTHDSVAERILAILERHLESLADELASGYDLVGFTTCFGQLFGNLLVASRIKQRNPATLTLLGGSSVSAAVGPSLLREYPCVDYIIQGEGELPLAALLRQLGSSAPGELEPRGVLSRSNLTRSPAGVPSWEVPNMDALPLPDYGGYAELADAAEILWKMPLEGSRGCWWDRGKRTGNPRDTCYFCNLNVQWDGYRQKSVDRLAREVDEMSSRHGNVVLFFLDNIARTQGLEDLAARLKQQGKDYLFFYEMRAQASPYEILCLWEAGLRWVQFGIEGLSGTFLERVGKGTSVIQNLQAMKTCYELDIHHGSANLILDFPGSTDQEVAETRDVITRYAIAYQPLHLSTFVLGLGSTVEQLREEFGVTRVRNADFWKAGLPEDVYERLVMLDRAGDFPHADWFPVRAAAVQWRRAQDKARSSEHRHLLTYLDGGDHLRIVDLRSERLRIRRLDAWERGVYLSAMEIARYADLVTIHTDGSPARVARLDALLDELAQNAWLYREGARCLSLAPASHPEFAARRIRAAHEQRVARRAARHPSGPGPEAA